MKVRNVGVLTEFPNYRYEAEGSFITFECRIGAGNVKQVGLTIITVVLSDRSYFYGI